MKIAYVTSEMVPFCKTGGLADVAGAICPSLAEEGHEVTAFLPRYKEVEAALPEKALKSFYFTISIGGVNMPATVYFYKIAANFKLCVIANEKYFRREGLYSKDGRDFPDNDERFIFFSRAVCEALSRMNEEFDVVHLNDWQTSLIAPYMRSLYQYWLPNSPRIVLTIHNLAYQGIFGVESFYKSRLPIHYFSMDKCEFYGKFNILKSGIVFSDRITTVSRKYSEEIQTPEFGAALEGLLTSRKNSLHGILNGVDYSKWNPATDKLIAANYSAQDMRGKKTNKPALQREMRLKSDAEIPLIGFAGRLAEQKGLDLIMAVIPAYLESGRAQFAFIGMGDTSYEGALKQLKQKFLSAMGLHIGFDERIAHLIEAGSDFFLMPSRFEPCGLNQMYSLKYGTIPIVRSTGGLADTIRDADEFPESGNGFAFAEYTAAALTGAIERALEAHKDKERLNALRLRGMAEDHSWKKRVPHYIDVYSLK